MQFTNPAIPQRKSLLDNPWNMTDILPTITIGIPVLNEERDMQRCLASIKMQDYPSDRIEVIVADGGSTDRTESIVKDFGYTFINNPEKKAEPGLALAFSLAKGEFFVNFAADNVLRGKDWFRQMIIPFQDNKEVIGTLCKVECDAKDDPFLKYFNSDTDPFSAFFYGNASHPDKFRRIYPIKKETDDYVIYKFDPVNYPLIAFAQGFIIRTSYKRPKETAFDDVLPIINMIESGHDIAYVKNVTISHFVFDNFKHYRRRMLRKISESFTDPGHGFHVREKHISPIRKLRQYLFVPYSLTIIGPLLSSFSKFMRKGHLYYFYEIPASYILAIYIIYLFITVRVLKIVNKPLNI